MSGVTHKIEEAVKALEKGQVKKALWLTDSVKTKRHHQIVSDAARQCLSDREQCSTYLKEAAGSLKDTITAPLDTTDLEGVEEMLEQPQTANNHQDQQTDEELYQNCEECHVVDAVVKFAEIGRQCSGEASEIETVVADESTPPEKWVREMKRIKDNATCGQKAYEEVWNELTSYLEERESPILKGLEGNG